MFYCSANSYVQAAQKDLDAKENPSSKPLNRREPANESESNLPAQADSGESDLSEDTGTDTDPTTLERPPRLDLSGGSNDGKTAHQDHPIPSPSSRAAVPVVRAAPAPRSRLPSCTAIVAFAMLAYFVLAFYELYTIFTPEARPVPAP